LRRRRDRTARELSLRTAVFDGDSLIDRVDEPGQLGGQLGQLQAEFAGPVPRVAQMLGEGGCP
jgi:hypothetical protein